MQAHDLRREAGMDDDGALDSEAQRFVVEVPELVSLGHGRLDLDELVVLLEDCFVAAQARRKDLVVLHVSASASGARGVECGMRNAYSRLCQIGDLEMVGLAGKPGLFEPARGAASS